MLSLGAMRELHTTNSIPGTSTANYNTVKQKHALKHTHIKDIK